METLNKFWLFFFFVILLDVFVLVIVHRHCQKPTILLSHL